MPIVPKVRVHHESTGGIDAAPVQNAEFTIDAAAISM